MATRRPAGPPDILSAEFAADPYAAYRVMREDFPLIRHEATDSYLISRYEDVQRAFKDPVFTSENYASVPRSCRPCRAPRSLSGA